MIKTLKITALTALLMGTIYGAQAETRHSVNELKKDIGDVVKVCKANEKNIESYSCLFVWVRDTLDACKKASKPKCGEVQKESDEMPYSTFKEQLDEYTSHVAKEEKAMNLVVAQVTMGKKSADEAYNELSPRLKTLETDCRDVFNDLNEATTGLWDLYGEMKGRTCRK